MNKAEMNKYLDYLWFIYDKMWCVEDITIQSCIDTNADYMKVIRQQGNFFPFLKKVIEEFAADDYLLPFLIERRDKMARLGELNSPTGCVVRYWTQWDAINDAVKNR